MWLTPESFEPRGVEISATRFSGGPALRVRHVSGAGIARVTGSDFTDGVIEVDVAGTVDPEASFATRSFARGFIGLAFRIEPGMSAYERIFVRPTNARSDDQLRRNHSAQYDSLRVGPGTVGYFRNLRIRPASRLAEAAQP